MKLVQYKLHKLQKLVKLDQTSKIYFSKTKMSRA